MVADRKLHALLRRCLQAAPDTAGPPRTEHNVEPADHPRGVRVIVRAVRILVRLVAVLAVRRGRRRRRARFLVAGAHIERGQLARQVVLVEIRAAWLLLGLGLPGHWLAGGLMHVQACAQRWIVPSGPGSEAGGRVDAAARDDGG